MGMGIHENRNWIHLYYMKKRNGRSNNNNLHGWYDVCNELPANAQTPETSNWIELRCKFFWSISSYIGLEIRRGTEGMSDPREGTQKTSGKVRIEQRKWKMETIIVEFWPSFCENRQNNPLKEWKSQLPPKFLWASVSGYCKTTRYNIRSRLSYSKPKSY